jgi:hypothetical protein
MQREHQPEFVGSFQDVQDNMVQGGYKPEHFAAAQPGEIDYTALAAIPDEKVRKLSCANMVRAAGYVSISDALVSRLIGGNHVLIHLEREEKEGLPNQGGDIEVGSGRKRTRTWRIKCLKDSWGDPVKPGDQVRWLVHRRNRDDLGLKLRSTDIKDMKRRGTAHKLETHHTAVVDEKGCIELTYADAAMLLDNWGVHFRSGEPISGYREHSSAQKRHPVTGELKHRWNWRYMEIPPEMYEELPKLTEPEKPKRKTRSDKGVKKVPKERLGLVPMGNGRMITGIITEDGTTEDASGVNVKTGREPAE